MLRTNDEEKHAKRNVDALEVPQFCLDVALFFASAEIRAYCDRRGGAECVHLPHCHRREIGLRALRIAGSVAAHCVVHARFGGVRLRRPKFSRRGVLLARNEFFAFHDRAALREVGHGSKQLAADDHLIAYQCVKFIES